MKEKIGNNILRILKKIGASFNIFTYFSSRLTSKGRINKNIVT